MAAVVVQPGGVTCPACSSYMHSGGLLTANEPPPAYRLYTCLNSKCALKGTRLRVPLQRIECEVEAQDEPPDA